MKAIIKKLIKALIPMGKGDFSFLNRLAPGWLLPQAPSF